MGTRERRARKRRPGLFACIGVEMANHPRALAAGRAMCTWAWGIAYSRGKELDGFVPRTALAGSWAGADAPADVDRLLIVGLVVPAPDHPEFGPGWKWLNYEAWNDTKEEIEAAKEAARVKMHDWRAKRAREEANGLVLRPVTASVTGNEPITNCARDGFVPISHSGPLSLDLDPSDRDPDLPGQDSAREPPDIAPAPPPSPAPPDTTGPPLREDASVRAVRELDDPTTPHPPENAPGGRPGWAPPGPALVSASPSGSRRRARSLATRRLEEPYVGHAFATGVESVTQGTYVVPADERRALDDAIDAHCLVREHGSARDDWICASVAAFRRAIAGREQFHRAGGPRGWLEWLNLGAPTAEWLAAPPSERSAIVAEAARRKASARRQRTQRDELDAQEREASTPEGARVAVAELLSAVAAGSTRR